MNHDLYRRIQERRYQVEQVPALKVYVVTTTDSEDRKIIESVHASLKGARKALGGLVKHRCADTGMRAIHVGALAWDACYNTYAIRPYDVQD